MTDPQIISHSSLQSLSAQVAGHEAGVQTLCDGAFVIKTCKRAEADFYQAAIAGSSSSLDEVRNYFPTFHGTVEIREEGVGELKQAVILENLTRTFERPNVLDVKLGQQLWDESASAEKRKRMEEASEHTTSGQLGLRLTGWQCWDERLGRFSHMTKKFGKSIKGPEEVALGLRLFMGRPAGGDAVKVKSIMAEEAPVSLPRLDADLTREVIEQYILTALDNVITLVSQLEWRVRGGSVLIIYEGDTDTLRSCLACSSPSPPPPGRRAGQRDETVDVHLPPAPAHLPRKRAVDIRLIDFAHVSLTPGQGPDPGYLLGLRNIRQLFADLL